VARLATWLVIALMKILEDAVAKLRTLNASSVAKQVIWRVIALMRIQGKKRDVAMIDQIMEHALTVANKGICLLNAPNLVNRKIDLKVVVAMKETKVVVVAVVTIDLKVAAATIKVAVATAENRVVEAVETTVETQVVETTAEIQVVEVVETTAEIQVVEVVETTAEIQVVEVIGKSRSRAPEQFVTMNGRTDPKF